MPLYFPQAPFRYDLVKVRQVIRQGARRLCICAAFKGIFPLYLEKPSDVFKNTDDIRCWHANNPNVDRGMSIKILGNGLNNGYRSWYSSSGKTCIVLA